MNTLKHTQTQIILHESKTSFVMFFNFSQHISGFFSLANIKKPSCILINFFYPKRYFINKNTKRHAKVIQNAK
jgi:hypothetical protein